MNGLACSTGNPHCVFQVVDCSSHSAKGEKKDAFYVCQQMLPKMREIDLERKHFDLIAFDEAANVQKAGTLINQYFPRCSHIVTLNLVRMRMRTKKRVRRRPKRKKSQ
jgi:hypothetical protein